MNYHLQIYHTIYIIEMQASPFGLCILIKNYSIDPLETRRTAFSALSGFLRNILFKIILNF